MSPDSQRIAIAEACGIVSKDQWGPLYKTPRGILRDCPDYLADLNAMHEAEDNLLGMNKAEFAVKLCRIVGRDWPNGIAGGSFAHVNATAAQRAEAFLRTVGKWEEGK